MPPPNAPDQPPYICALIVAFNPDAQRLREVAAAIAPQVRALLVVDNGSTQSPAPALAGIAGTPCSLLELGDNLGIAAAQNIGLAWAQGQGASHVLLLDHDAVAAPGMVASLLAQMQSRGPRAAAVGPLITDPRRGKPAPFFRLSPWAMRRVTAPEPGEHSAQVDFLIAAGALISLQALADIGPMREDLFIDYVDLEWSMRATARGYRLYGHFGAWLDHRLGEEPLRFLGRRFMAHSPLRHYYMARNALKLWRLPHARASWIGFDAFALCVRACLFSALPARRAEHRRMILRGLRDGLRGRYGRIDQAASDWQVPDAVRAREPRLLNSA